MGKEQIFLSVVLWALSGLLTGYIAKKRGRDPGFWFFIGAVLGLVGFIILLVLPDAREVKKADLLDVNPSDELELEKKKVFLFPRGGWYFATKDREREGPLSWEDLQSAYKDSRIDLVWNEGMEEWKPLAEIPDLIKSLETEEEND